MLFDLQHKQNSWQGINVLQTVFNALADEENGRVNSSFRKTKYRTCQRCPKNKNLMGIGSSEAVAAAVPALSIGSTITARWRKSRLFARLQVTRASAESMHRFVLTRCSGLRGCRGLLYSSVDDNHTLLRMEKWRLIDFTAIAMERQWMCHQFNPLFNGSNLVRKCSLN